MHKNQVSAASPWDELHKLTTPLTVLTTMMVNAILGGIADTTAQTLTSIRRKHSGHIGGANSPRKPDETVAIEIRELDRKDSWPPGDMISRGAQPPPPFDFERLTRFMSFGFLMAPLQFKWFGFLTTVFPASKAAGMLPALKRVAFDQLIAAPIGMLPHSEIIHTRIKPSELKLNVLTKSRNRS